MTFDTFNAVLFTATFLIPGFIWASILSMVYPRRAQAIELRVLEFLTLSCVNHGLWIWLMIPVFRGDFMDRHPFWAGVLMILPVLASPIALGLATGRLYQHDQIKRVLGRLGFRTVHPIPTAWDYHFSRSLPYWVIVRLQDGSSVYGLYGYNSFAGDDPAERDLYIEAMFTPTPSGEWAPVEDSGGIIIKAEQIAAIEFRKNSEVNYER